MKRTMEYQNVQENRQYKSDLFCMAFGEKQYLLQLYNALNGTAYTNVDDLEVNTLDQVLYMGMKNDISFLIGSTMNLYEHQSTQNANMPLRGLFYFSKLYERYVTENGLNIYSSKLKKLPTPKYVVLYNGMRDEPDERILRLSDAFSEPGGCLECEARLVNINAGHNRELMEKCRRLEEYAIFIGRVRTYAVEGLALKAAILKAMDECAEEGILQDILEKERAEVLGMVLSTFNKELYEKELKEDAFNAGKAAGKLELIQRKLEKGKSVEEIADDLEESVETIRELMG